MRARCQCCGTTSGTGLSRTCCATRRSASTNPERVLLQISDGTYALLLTALWNFYGDRNSDLAGTFRMMALAEMDVMNDVNRAVVHAGLLPPFKMP